MRGYTAFCYFIGLVAANSLPIQPREDTSNFKGITGEICCNRGTTDPNNLCHDAKLNAYCVSLFQHVESLTTVQRKQWKNNS